MSDTLSTLETYAAALETLADLASETAPETLPHLWDMVPADMLADLPY